VSRRQTAETTTYPHRTDLDLIAFDQSSQNQGSFELTADLARHDGVLAPGSSLDNSVRFVATVMDHSRRGHQTGRWLPLGASLRP
jgi:hypothetical protein